MTVRIKWDSLTLKSIPPEQIVKCEEEGLSWTEMNLYASEMVPAVARDTEDDVAATVKELESLYNWEYIRGEQAKQRLTRQLSLTCQSTDHLWRNWVPVARYMAQLSRTRAWSRTYS